MFDSTLKNKRRGKLLTPLQLLAARTRLSYFESYSPPKLENESSRILVRSVRVRSFMPLLTQTFDHSYTVMLEERLQLVNLDCSALSFPLYD